MLLPISHSVRSAAVFAICWSVAFQPRPPKNWAKGACYYTESSQWSYVDSAYRPRDPRFLIPIPPLFEHPRILELSTDHAKDPVNSYHWKQVPPDSVFVSSGFVMESFRLRGTIRGDSLRAELVYMHDSYPDRRADVFGRRIECPKDRTSSLIAYQDPHRAKH